MIFRGVWRLHCTVVFVVSFSACAVRRAGVYLRLRRSVRPITGGVLGYDCELLPSLYSPLGRGNGRGVPEKTRRSHVWRSTPLQGVRCLRLVTDRVLVGSICC